MPYKKFFENYKYLYRLVVVTSYIIGANKSDIVGGVFKMRFALSLYNPVKECSSRTFREENEVSAHILAYQVAYHLIRNHAGTMSMNHNTLDVIFDSLEEPLTINLRSGYLNYKSLNVPLLQYYASGKRAPEIAAEIHDYLALPVVNPTIDYEIYGLLTKLVEIYHARCGLQIITLENSEGKIIWELQLSEQGLPGWISSDGIAKNRFGEVLELQDWKHLRLEKLAAYVFGFNRYCSHYPSPLKESSLN